jgi:hypothetical protein
MLKLWSEFTTTIVLANVSEYRAEVHIPTAAVWKTMLESVGEWLLCAG